MHKPLKSHLKIALKVLRYLKGSLGKGVHIVRCPKVSLETFVDADWAKCLVTRRSVTGFCLFLNGSLISWKSKKQNTFSKSTTKAEYRAMSLATSNTVWVEFQGISLTEFRSCTSRSHYRSISKQTTRISQVTYRRACLMFVLEGFPSSLGILFRHHFDVLAKSLDLTMASEYTTQPII
ncbi:hypothetical protein Tco_0772109 [Tanacetum coccineum]|uniref:Uncharacterized protein n=1 Tax=Tanacetum coccineum TaxID=301880 RepID=A0ABQ4ZH00_9ASTR